MSNPHSPEHKPSQGSQGNEEITRATLSLEEVARVEDGFLSPIKAAGKKIIILKSTEQGSVADMVGLQTADKVGTKSEIVQKDVPEVLQEVLDYLSPLNR